MSDVLPLQQQSVKCRTAEESRPVEVTWVLPEDPGHVANLDRICAGVGPVAVVTSDAPPAGTAPSAIAIVTWNTFLGRGDLAALVSWLRDEDGPRARDYVLLLQEVFRGPLLQAAADLGVHAFYAPTRRRAGDADDRGAAILATRPLDRLLVVELPFQKQRRLAIGARVGAALHVVNAHFDTSVGLLRGGPGADRRSQARALIEAIDHLPAPLVVAGDFNTWWGDDEPAIAELRRAFPDAAPLEARATWRGPLGTSNKLDYLFAKGMPVEVRRVESRFGSDHWPLVAEARLNAE